MGTGPASRPTAVVGLLFVLLMGCAGTADSTGTVRATVPAGIPATPTARDVFVDGLDLQLADDPDRWLAWALVDRTDGRRIGSANSATERTNAESSIKVWIAADYLRVANEAGRTVSANELALIDRAIRASDDTAAETMYRRLGADNVLAHLQSVCGVSVATDRPHYWSYTQITAVDATRILGCALERAPRYAHGDRLIDALHHVDPDGAFGIPEAFGPDTGMAVKNGWTRHETAGSWNVNCVAAWDRYTLAVLTRFPADRSRDHGAAVCRDVATAVRRGLG